MAVVILQVLYRTLFLQYFPTLFLAAVALVLLLRRHLGQCIQPLLLLNLSHNLFHYQQL
jgi:hypothetical protein